MAATLNIKNSFELTINGQTISGSHGTAGESAEDPFAITLEGLTRYHPSQLANSAAIKVWDEDTDSPVNFDYLFVWSDQILYIQLIAATLNVQIPIKAKVPFVLGFDDILAAINTTVLDGSATPTTEDIDSVLLVNRSGSTANYVFFCGD